MASGRVSTGVWRAAGAAQRHALPLWIGSAALTATGRVLGDVHWCAAAALVHEMVGEEVSLYFALGESRGR